MKLKAIIFDLDNTIIDANRAYCDALGTIGLSPRGRSFINARNAVKKNLPQGHTSSHSRLLYFKELLIETGNYTPQKLLKLTDIYEKSLSIAFSTQWRILKRDRLFNKIRMSYSIAVVTNENLRTQTIKLNAIDPEAKYFGTVVTSEEVGTEKPNLKIFKIALKRLGVRASECMMVGDDFLTDLKPASKLGMKTTFTSEFTKSNPKLPSTVFRMQKLSQLIEMLNE